MTSPAQIIADNLAALPHPDGTPRQLPGFATQLMPEQMAQQIKQAATELGEAIVNLLETTGYQVITRAPAEQPATPTAPEVASVYCAHCEARVLQLNITNPARVMATHHFAVQKCPNS